MLALALDSGRDGLSPTWHRAPQGTYEDCESGAKVVSARKWVASAHAFYHCRQTVKEDKALICEDWKDSILPLLDSPPFSLSPDFFSIGQYFAARSLISSRSFEIDDYHGFGMVPLADL